MIKLEKTKVVGIEEAIRGMRNPMNSWEKSDSDLCSGTISPYCYACTYRVICSPMNPVCDTSYTDMKTNVIIGQNDHDLMMRLAEGGSVHAKYRRMITVYVDITAPLYWWKEFDTYKVGTVANSCSTMHKIHAKEFELGDFSIEHLYDSFAPSNAESPINVMDHMIYCLNFCRDLYLETKDKKYWWQMIQLLPTSYNQKRTVMLNYEVLAGIYPMRKDHKLDEWHDFCDWIKFLPYSEVMVG